MSNVNNCSAVIFNGDGSWERKDNFDIPKNLATYLHRIGRSGRWGRKGTGINFVTRRDMSRIKEIEKYYNTEIQELPENYTKIISR